MTAQTIQVLMPKLGLTMEEGMLTAWSVGSGDRVASGDTLFLVETDKVVSEVVARVDGVISSVLVGEGETVAVGTVVALVAADASGARDVDRQPMIDLQEPEQTVDMEPASPSAMLAHSEGAGERIVATPYARRMARERGVDLAQVRASNGVRIRAADVHDYCAAEPEATAIPDPAATARGASRSREVLQFVRQSSLTALRSLLGDVASLIHGHSSEEIAEAFLAKVVARAFALATGQPLGAVRVGGPSPSGIDYRTLADPTRDSLSQVAKRLREKANVIPPSGNANTVVLFVAQRFGGGIMIPFLPEQCALAVAFGSDDPVRSSESAAAPDPLATIVMVVASDDPLCGVSGRILSEIAKGLSEPLLVLAG